MHDLWEEETQPQPKKRSVSRQSAISVTSVDCQYFWHAWMSAGMQGEKLCSACGAKGFCPVCNPFHRGDALPFLCTRHSIGEVQA